MGLGLAGLSLLLLGMSSELLSIETRQLQFPFELKKQMSCSLRLWSETEDLVAFKEAPHMHRKDKLHIQIVIATPGATQKDMTTDMEGCSPMSLVADNMNLDTSAFKAVSRSYLDSHDARLECLKLDISSIKKALIWDCVNFILRYYTTNLTVSAIALGFLNFFGSLFAKLLGSMIIRDAGDKDSGSLIPGPGGILDRVDSSVFTGALAYSFVKAFLPMYGV